MANGIFRIAYGTLGAGSKDGKFYLEIEDENSPYTLSQIKGMIEAFLKSPDATHTEEGLLKYINKNNVPAKKPEDAYDVTISKNGNVKIIKR